MYAKLYDRDNLAWKLVEEITSGSYTLKAHYRLRRSFCDMMNFFWSNDMMNSEDGGSMSSIADETDSDTEEDDGSFMADDEDIEDDYGQQDPPTSSDEWGTT